MILKQDRGKQKSLPVGNQKSLCFLNQVKLFFNFNMYTECKVIFFKISNDVKLAKRLQNNLHLLTQVFTSRLAASSNASLRQLVDFSCFAAGRFWKSWCFVLPTFIRPMLIATDGSNLWLVLDCHQLQLMGIDSRPSRSPNPFGHCAKIKKTASSDKSWPELILIMTEVILLTRIRTLIWRLRS